MGEKVFLFNNSNKKITTDEKIGKNSGASSTTARVGVWGLFKCYIHNKHYPLVLYCANTSVTMYSADYHTTLGEYVLYMSYVFDKCRMYASGRPERRCFL